MSLFKKAPQAYFDNHPKSNSKTRQAELDSQTTDEGERQPDKVTRHRRAKADRSKYSPGSAATSESQNSNIQKFTKLTLKPKIVTDAVLSNPKSVKSSKSPIFTGRISLKSPVADCIDNDS